MKTAAALQVLFFFYKTNGAVYKEQSSDIYTTSREEKEIPSNK